MKPNPFYRWDWPAATLLVAAIFTAAVRLDTTSWTPDLDYVEALAVLGTILGLALGISQFRAAALRWLVSGYTLIFVPAQLCRIITGEKTVFGQLGSLGGRLLVSFEFLFSGKAVEDHLFFVTLMCTLFWMIGIYSGYRLIRHPAVFPVLLPSTLPVLIIQYYDGYKTERIWGLAVYFFLALLLTGRMNLLKARERWEEQHVLAGGDLEFDLNRNMAIVAAVIILFSWMLPAPAAVLPAAAHAWKNLTGPFENTRQRLNDMLAALNGASTLGTAAGQLYGKEMSLGRNAGSGTAEVFRVHPPSNSLPRLYWRVRAYDLYLNGNWQTSNSQDSPFDPDQGNLVRSEIMPAPSGEFIFTWQASRSAVLVTPSLPVWASRTGSFQIARDKEANTDPLSWSIGASLQTGDQYQVRALLLNPTRKELRISGDAYPIWIKQRYLQVPENISADLTRLALQITAEKPTTFDKVEAVTDYLRQNMSYSDTIPAAPPGMDPLNWFLFGWKSGFCNYYASAEVMLLRSLGIPARMVVGYAQGKSNSNGVYTVRMLDAHAWPEVYFSGIGWVEFEPTVSQTAILRPSGEETAAPGHANDPRISQLDEDPGVVPANQQPITASDSLALGELVFLGLTLNVWLWVIISALILALAAFILLKLERRQSFTQRIPRSVKAIYAFYNLKSPAWLEHWVRWSEVSRVERAFHAVNQSLSWLRKPQAGHLTPAERSETLKSLLPAASANIDFLTAALEQTLYTPHPADPATAARQGWIIRFLTVRKLILGRFFGE